MVDTVLVMHTGRPDAQDHALAALPQQHGGVQLWILTCGASVTAKQMRLSTRSVEAAERINWSRYEHPSLKCCPSPDLIYGTVCILVRRPSI